MPYNAIAKAAGVGQGVLYRHFPRRVDLALAVFDDNFTAMERLAEATPVHRSLRCHPRRKG